MFRSGEIPLGRAAMVLILVGLLIVIIGLSYILLVERNRPAAPAIGAAPAGEGTVQVSEAKRMGYALAILLVAVLSILAFVLGSYLLIRVGRMVTQQRVGGKPTDYSDAWSKYRLTDQDIDAATAEHGTDAAADDSSSAEDQTEGSDEEPDDSGSRE